MFSRFLARLESGESLSIERFCEDHPEVIDELRVVYSDWEESGADPTSERPREAAPPREPGEPVTRIDDVHPGLWVAEYELARKIDEGGMGQVWEAIDHRLRRRVAVKLMKPGKDGERAVQYFQREGRAAARLKHPGIVTVYAAGEAHGVPYIVQELVAGGRTLARMLEEEAGGGRPRPGEFRESAELILAIARALESAHAAGVIHRDVKPKNLLVDEDGRPMLVDFGLARILDEDSVSKAGDLAGTYAYMSPEQVALKRIPIDHRTDLFSLGIVMYEVLTGTRPFHGETGSQIAHEILFEEPRNPRAVRPEVPRDLSVICTKCLEKNPALRYASAADLSADLERFLNGEPIVAQPPGAARRLQRWLRRHPMTVAVAMLVALVGVVVLALDRAADRRAAHLSLDSEPSGAVVSLRRVDWETGEYGPPRRVGRTPLRSARVAPGYYRVVLQSDAGLAELPLQLATGPAAPARIVVVRPTAEVAAGMVAIPAGEFTGGFAVESDNYAQQRCTLEAFLIDPYEVTNAEYRAFLAANPEHPEPVLWQGRADPSWDEKPVVGVSWEDAQAYATWAGKRLPTRLEWGRAARGPDAKLYPWGDDERPDLAALACVDRAPAPAPTEPLEWFALYLEQVPAVGSHPLDRSPDGVWDVLGSVSEWVDSVDVSGGQPNLGVRCARGPSWVSRPGQIDLRRISTAPKNEWITEACYGFRCAKSLDP